MKDFWGSYLEMVGLLLCFVCATREGDWKAHSICVRDMISYMIAYDQVNYAWYLPVYWMEMLTLKEQHPATYEHFSSGNFAGKHQWWIHLNSHGTNNRKDAE